MNKDKEELLKREEDFHDDWADSINIDEVLVDEFMEACTAPENRWLTEKIGDIKGLRILELGCGAGEASVYFAKKGANAVATDLSGGMLRVVEQLAAKHGVTVETKKSSADEIDFPDASFDVVYAANLLHHVDIEKCLIEVNRVLKPGGRFLSWDPLAHNPAINIYRRQAMEVRTEDEHPIKWSQIKLFKKHFSKVEYKTTWFFTLWIFIRFKFFEKVDPNKERYWKKIINEHKRLEKQYLRLERRDKWFLKIFPFFKRWCWNISFVCVKGEK
jgi:ubiquinone/menaquinone biosynthesis C-methylase UbiE